MVEGKAGRGREEKVSSYGSLHLSLGFSFQLRNLETRANHYCAPFYTPILREPEKSQTKSMQNSIFPSLMCSIAIFIEEDSREMRQETKQL